MTVTKLLHLTKTTSYNTTTPSLLNLLNHHYPETGELAEPTSNNGSTTHLLLLIHPLP